MTRSSSWTMSFSLCVLTAVFGHAAEFHPTTVADLIAAITIANGNGESDLIDLGGNGFSLNTTNYANDLTDGRNGLPSILSDSGNSLTIQNGKIVRSSISPAHAFRLLHLSVGANVVLNNVTLANGLASASDISILGTSGGAIFNNQANLTIERVIFQNNHATNFGGALTNFSGAVVTNISDSTFQKNSALSFGGAIHNDPSSIIWLISGSLFADNTSETNGGAISNFTAVIDTIVNSTFSYNVASDNGGAIANSTSATINNILNSTIASNIAGHSGGGAWNENSSIIGSIESSIVADNHAIHNPDLFGLVTNAAFNLIGISQGNNIVDGVASNQVGTSSSPLDPSLSGLADNGGVTKTRAIAWGSRGHNTGSNPLGLSSDQRGLGFARSVFSSPDIGAYELQ